MYALFKTFIKSIPVAGKILIYLNKKIKDKRDSISPSKFQSSRYWESRYIEKGNSGAGSYNHLAEFKAKVINKFISDNSIHSVIEFGCGDGNQLKLANYPGYIGFDVSSKSIQICKEIFLNDKSKDFRLVQSYSKERGDLSISLDVIYHLVEDEVFHAYMKNLFSASKQYVIIYSSNTENQSLTSAVHVRHRKFTDWVEINCSGWRLIKHLPNKYPYDGNTDLTSFADFYFYEISAE